MSVNKRIVLPPASGITGRFLEPSGEYRNFRLWKRTEGYKKWRSNQWHKQRGLCAYCDTNLTKTKVNIEHVTPMSKGGKTIAKNLVLSCWQCNKNKGSVPLSRKQHTELDLKRKHMDKKQLKAKRRYAVGKMLEEKNQETIASELRWIMREEA